MNIWTRYIGGYIQECTVLCVKALDSLCTFSISRGHFFFEMTFEINHKNSPHLWEIGCFGGGGGGGGGGLKYFWSYLCPCYFQCRVELDRKISSR